MKIVLVSVFIGITVASLFNATVASESMITVIFNIISTLLMALVQGAAWVTVIFAIFEYKNVNLTNDSHWDITHLPEIPNKKTLISRGESIVAIIFTTFFFSILYFTPQFFMISFRSGGTDGGIHIFNLDLLAQNKHLIISVFLVTVLQESLKIFGGRWTQYRAIVNLFLSVGSSILTIIFFTNKSLWNDEVIALINNFFDIELDINYFINGMFAIIVLVAIIETLSSIYKVFKYKK